jgi:hypothetical protein
VLHEARKIYEFEVCGLRVEADRVSFYINAADGVVVIFLNRGQLPKKTATILKKLEPTPIFSAFFFALG